MGILLLFQKNQSAVLAAEILEDDNIFFDLIEYNHYALTGDLSEKKKILTSIGAYVEPILKNRVFVLRISPAGRHKLFNTKSTIAMGF